MAYLCVLCQFQILQNGPGGHDAAVQMGHAKAFQRLDTEMAQQLLLGRLFCIDPLIEHESNISGTKIFLKINFFVALVEHLLGLKVAQQFLYVVGSAFAQQKLTSRNVKKADTASCPSEVDRSQKVVLLVVQHIVAQGHTRRHQFGDATLHQLLRQFGVFQLIADGHALAGPDQLGQIGVEGMMRKAGHLVALHACAVVALGQRDAQNACSNHRIFAVSLIEVTTSEQKYCVGMLLLQIEELLHHGRQLPVFLCHFFLYYFYSLQRYNFFQ